MFRKLKSKLENNKVNPVDPIPKIPQENITTDSLIKPLVSEQIQNESVEKLSNIVVTDQNKIDELIKIIKTSDEKLIAPTLDLMTGKYL